MNGDRLLKSIIVLCALMIGSFCLADPQDVDTDLFTEASAQYREKQYSRAFPIFLSLAEKGDARAQTVTAIMYKFGEGIEQDLTQAFRWYATAAKQNYPAAQFYTGLMLAEGAGVERDQAAAIEWLTLAAENGFERATERLSALNASADAANRSDNELLPWSQNWDLRLPMSMVLDNAEKQVTPEVQYQVQVGAMGTQGAANRLWEILATNNAALFVNRQPIIILSEESERRVYRVQTGPFSDLQSANDFCSRLLSRAVQAGCLPQKMD